jgi:hypothetical protein
MIGAFDPGYSHLGNAWYKPRTQEALIQNHDLTHWNGVYHSLEVPDFGSCFLDLFRTLEPLFMQCQYIGIEKQPAKIGTQPAPRDIFACMLYIEQTIRVLFPHITIFYTDTKAVRKWWGTGGKGGHAESKQRSWLAGTLPANEITRAKKLFGTTHPDPVEALQIAMYVEAHLEKLLAEQPPTPKRSFGKLELTSLVQHPVVKPKKKRVAKVDAEPRKKRKVTK